MEDCNEDYGNSHRLHSSDGPNMAPKKFNSYDSEDQVDSGLGSLGYVSGDLESYDNSRKFAEAIVEEDEVQTQHSHSRDSEKIECDSANLRPLDNIVNSLDNLTIDSKHSTDPSRCDSGLDEFIKNSSVPSTDPLLHNVNEHWVSPFSPPPEQIMDIFTGDEDGDNHLHMSIIHGLPEVSMQIIGLAPDAEWLSQANNMMQTPLHLAVITRQVTVVRRLMCAGAAVDVRDLAGNTPLHNACRLGFEDVVRTLLTPVIFEETYQNRYEINFQRIPQDLESKNYEGLTSLHLAALGGHFSVMRLLLSAGANVNAAEGKGGKTVLHLAADWGHIEMLKHLLSRQETNIDARTYSGLTPILLAYGRKHLDAVEELYKQGASCETLSLSEESEEDMSDEEMMDEVSSLSNHSHNVAAGRSFQPTNR